MLVIGDDLHVRNSVLHVSDAAGGVVLRGCRVRNEDDAFGTFWRQLVQRRGGEVEPVRVVVEATTNTRAAVSQLRRTAAPLGIPVTVDVVNPRQIRLIAESVNKHDAVDARILSELACSNLELPLCYMPDDEEFALREHLRARQDLVKLRTMLKNRVHAVLHRRGLLRPTGGVFTKDGRRYLGELPLDEAGRTLIERFCGLIDALDCELTVAQQQLRQLAQRPRWRGPAALLRTMPGLGLIGALTILAELGDIGRFPSRAAVANYAGLVPTLRSSDDNARRGHITRHGSAHLRWVLAEAAWVAIRRVPGYRAQFDRVRQRRGPQIAIVAVARRMLEDGYVLLKKQVPFRFDAVRGPAAGPSVLPEAFGNATSVAG